MLWDQGHIFFLNKLLCELFEGFREEIDCVEFPEWNHSVNTEGNGGCRCCRQNRRRRESECLYNLLCKLYSL